MKNFLAVYLGSADSLEKSGWNTMDEQQRKERERAGMQAWSDWMEKHDDKIVYTGGPLGKTRRVSAQGTAEVRNEMAGFVVIEAESYEAAARLFENHPHFSIFPGEAVEIMECLPLPSL